MIFTIHISLINFTIIKLKHFIREDLFLFQIHFLSFLTYFPISYLFSKFLIPFLRYPNKEHLSTLCINFPTQFTFIVFNHHRLLLSRFLSFLKKIKFNLSHLNRSLANFSIHFPSLTQ